MESNKDYWSQCIIKLREHKDKVVLSSSLERRLYVKGCSYNEEIKLLETINKCIEKSNVVQRKIVILYPMFVNHSFEKGDMNQQYFKIKLTNRL